MGFGRNGKEELGRASTLVVALAAIALLSSCSREDETVSLTKCMFAAKQLDDRELSLAGELRAHSVLKGKTGSAREAMELGQKVREELYPLGEGTRIDQVLGRATDWRTGSYCTSVLNDFRAAIKTEVETAVARPLSVECTQYLELARLSASPYAQQYGAQLPPKMNAILSMAVPVLPEFKRQPATAQLAVPQFRRELEQLCQSGGNVPDKINATAAMQAVRSEKSRAIESRVSEFRTTRSCGDFQDVFCRSELMADAAIAAMKESEKCDRALAPADSCNRAPDAFIGDAYRLLEIEVLGAAKAKLAKDLAAPAKADYNLAANVQAKAEACKLQGVKQGLRGAAYYDYVNTTCVPQAQTQYLKPKNDLLERIDRRLAELNSR
jgi:hypothetical protein